MPRSLYACFGAVALLLVSAVPAFAEEGQAADPAAVEFFEKKVRPILATRCHECHSAAEQKGSLRLDSRAAVMTGGDTGPAIVPSKPDESLLVDAVRYGDTYQMPPTSQLAQEEIDTLVEWVRQGAGWGVEAAASEPAAKVEAFDLAARAQHWSFQPLADPAPPEVVEHAWVHTPVDRYILAKLEAANLRPAPAADKRTLIRRVTFDLTGLPPTPAEIDAFLTDTSGTAYETVVDRLLASPHYGERWARHWLDLVRYAETRGHEFDFDIPNAYRYRDYVIRALNADVPYDRFVIEHVAGDLLPEPRRNPEEGFNESIIGTGWYAFGEAVHSPVDVRGDEATRIDNQIDVFSKTFLGLTVSCARCHDHKFDAISTKDYYALAGYLQSSRYQQAYIDPPEQLADAIARLKAIRAEREQACREFIRAAYAPELTETAHREELLAKLQTTATANDRQDAVMFQFDGNDFGPWTATGAAFGDGPAQPLDWDFCGPREAFPGRLLTAGTAHSGRISPKLHGVLRSPTFEITTPRIWYRAYGEGGKVRLIVDGLELIRNPIYGGLEFTPGGHEPRWHEQDVSKWVGHRAYIELVDDGDGYVALEQVALSADAASAAEPAPLLTPIATADSSSRNETLRKSFAAFDERQRAIEQSLAPPRTVPALADGTSENEHVFIRGNHKTLGDEVPRRFLEALGGTRHTPPDRGSGRLELARQLVSPECPLTSRIIVNRLWHHHFGSGLVRSPDDFGVMGQPPTHPKLLDYLAHDLVANGWSLKHLHRQMVLSSTYQMSSHVDPAVDAADPQNKLWHRMQVRRLEAEAIRDAVLAVSGQLDPAMYGPSVMPHLTEFMVGRGRPAESGPLDGDRRRSIYLAVRRNFLSPMFLAFDYPTPFTTIGRRGTSNVPAQALTMMNNPFVIQQAGLWAERVLKDPVATPEERVKSMYVTAFGREAEPSELESALAFAATNDAAAWAELAHVLLNVKEFIYIQ